MSTVDNPSDEELFEKYYSDDGNLSEEFGLYHEQRETDEDILSFSSKDIVNERQRFTRVIPPESSDDEKAPLL